MICFEKDDWEMLFSIAAAEKLPMVAAEIK
jgi:hypothetical protein